MLWAALWRWPTGPSQGPRRTSTSRSSRRSAISTRPSSRCAAVDLFIPSEPFDFYESARARRARVWFGERSTWVWSAEDIAVFKMLFDRAKDHEDVRRMSAHLGRAFDAEYVRGWLERLVGAGDHRLEDLAALVKLS